GAAGTGIGAVITGRLKNERVPWPRAQRPCGSQRRRCVAMVFWVGEEHGHAVSRSKGSSVSAAWPWHPGGSARKEILSGKCRDRGGGGEVLDVEGSENLPGGEVAAGVGDGAALEMDDVIAALVDAGELVGGGARRAGAGDRDGGD